jgi:hypothetical protein
MSDPKYIDIKEFREIGLLQELNRQFLHPMGLALEVVINEDGTESLGQIWDYRTDPEGIIYEPGMIEREKYENILNHWRKMQETRRKSLGYMVQPLEENNE